MVILSSVCSKNAGISFAMNLVHSMIENCELFQSLLDTVCDCGECNMCVILDILFYRKSHDSAFEKLLTILPVNIDPDYYPHEVLMFLLTTLRLNDHTNFGMIKSKERCDMCDNAFETDADNTEQILRLTVDSTVNRCHVTELIARYFKGEVLCDHCGKRSSQFKKIGEIKNYLLIEIQRFGSEAEVMVPTTLSMKTSLVWYHLTLCGVACSPKGEASERIPLTSYTYDQLGRWCFVDGDEFEVVDDLTSSFDIRQTIGTTGRFFVYALAAQEDVKQDETGDGASQPVKRTRGRKPQQGRFRPKRRGPRPGEELPGASAGKTNLAKPFRASMKPGLQCDECGKKLVDKDGLRRHKVRMHSENRPQKQRRRKQMMKPKRLGPQPGSVVAMQVLRMRAEGRVQVCPVCSFNLGSRVLLLLHLESAHMLRAIVTKRFRTVEECERWRRRLAEECCDVDVDVIAPIMLEPNAINEVIANQNKDPAKVGDLPQDVVENVTVGDMPERDVLAEVLSGNSIENIEKGPIENETVVAMGAESGPVVAMETEIVEESHTSPPQNIEIATSSG